MTLATLKDIIKTMPDTPGVYRFQDVQKQDIYIGKASSIKKRLFSYLKTTDPRIQKMVATAERLTHIETNSDIEALILESQLIKQHRPQFNIMLRDDKQYFYVGFTSDKFPRIFLTHQPESAGESAFGPSSGGGPAQRGDRRDWSPGSGAKDRSPSDSIGPFTDGVALKATLKYLRNNFPYCTCAQKHHNFCLNYHIRKCLGVCCLKQPDAISSLQLSISNYGKNVKAIKNILNGRKSFLVKELKKEMEAAGQKHDFDRAIELRAKIERLEQVFRNAQIIKYSEILKSYSSSLPALLKIKKPIIRIEGYDISNIQGQHATGAMVTFVNGFPDKNFYRKFKIRQNPHKFSSENFGGLPQKWGDTQMLAQILERRFNHPEWPFPDLILIDGGQGQVSSTLTILKEMNISIPVLGISKNEKHIGHQLIIPRRKQPFSLTKLNIIDKNLLLAIDAEAHRFAISHYRKLHRLNLSSRSDTIKSIEDA